MTEPSSPASTVTCPTCKDTGGGYITVPPGPWDGDIAYEWEDCPDCPHGEENSENFTSRKKESA